MAPMTFHDTGVFLCHQKTSGNLWFSDVFQGVWKEISIMKCVKDIFKKHVSRMFIFMIVPWQSMLHECALKRYKVSMFSDLSWFQGTTLSSCFWLTFMAENWNSVFIIGYNLKAAGWSNFFYYRLQKQNYTNISSLLHVINLLFPSVQKNRVFHALKGTLLQIWKSPYMF